MSKKKILFLFYKIICVITSTGSPCTDTVTVNFNPHSCLKHWEKSSWTLTYNLFWFCFWLLSFGPKCWGCCFCSKQFKAILSDGYFCEENQALNFLNNSACLVTRIFILFWDISFDRATHMCWQPPWLGRPKVWPAQPGNNLGFHRGVTVYLGLFSWQKVKHTKTLQDVLGQFGIIKLRHKPQVINLWLLLLDEGLVHWGAANHPSLLLLDQKLHKYIQESIKLVFDWGFVFCARWW